MSATTRPEPASKRIDQIIELIDSVLAETSTSTTELGDPEADLSSIFASWAA